MIHDRIALARSVLEAARQQHMLALQAAIAAGTPNDELQHDVEAFASATRQLLKICSAVSGGAPMELVAST